MRLEGERTTVSKWIRGKDFVVHVMVDAVMPVDDPYEPYLEAETTRFLDHLQELANARNITELENHGTIYFQQAAKKSA